MAKRGHRAGGAMALWIGAMAVAGCASAPVVHVPTGHPTAAAACRAAAGQNWRVAVEVDDADSAALALVSGDSIATCLTGRNTDEPGYGSTAIGVGRHPFGTQPALTYLTSSATSNDLPDIVVGRVPPATNTVRLMLADGSEQDATIGGDVWLARLSIPSMPTRIEALDASGATISKIESADGIEPAD